MSEFQYLIIYHFVSEFGHRRLETSDKRKGIWSIKYLRFSSRGLNGLSFTKQF